LVRTLIANPCRVRQGVSSNPCTLCLLGLEHTMTPTHTQSLHFNPLSGIEFHRTVDCSNPAIRSFDDFQNLFPHLGSLTGALVPQIRWRLVTPSHTIKHHHLTSRHTTPHLTTPHLISSPHTTSHLTSPHLTIPHLTSPQVLISCPFTTPHLTSPPLTLSHVLTSHLISSHLTPPHLAKNCK
jgi:hypothetical protein